MGLRDPGTRQVGTQRPLGPCACSWRSTSGFTLVEIVVVLVVLGLGAALVAPALIPPDRETPASIAAVIDHVQDMAARRGETLVLEVTSGGSWQVFGTAAIEEGPLEAGELSSADRLGGLTLRVAPLGSCGTTLDSDTAGTRLSLDPLTCRVIAP